MDRNKRKQAQSVHHDESVMKSAFHFDVYDSVINLKLKKKEKTFERVEH